MYVNEPKARDYLEKSYDLPPLALRLCSNLFNAANDPNITKDPERLLLTVLDAIGFDESDVAQLRRRGVIKPYSLGQERFQEHVTQAALSNGMSQDEATKLIAVVMKQNPSMVHVQDWTGLTDAAMEIINVFKPGFAETK